MNLRYKTYAIVFNFVILNLFIFQQAYASHQATNRSPETIDALDSVFFSLTQAQISGNIVEIPVYIHSDDNIYTLDFSFKLDTNFLIYVDLIDHTNHIQHTEYFNNLDLKLRFTSNSFMKYPKGNSRVVSLKFRMKANSVKKEYFSVLMTYLNGDQSSRRVKGNDIIINSIKEEREIASFIQMWPNPGRDLIYVKNAEIEQITITTTGGLPLNHVDVVSQNSSEWILNTSSLPEGSYFVIIRTKKDKIFYKKLIIIR